MLRPSRPPLAWRTRAGLLVLIALLHSVIAIGLLAMMQRRGQASADVVTVIEFIRSSPVPAVPPVQRVAPSSVPRIEPPRVPAARQRTEAPIAHDSILEAHAARPDREQKRNLELYGADGRLRTPDDLLEKLDREFGDERVFSYQIPRLDDAQRLLHRDPPIEYRPTRFDQHWRPDKDLLSDVLEKLVKKTTREIRIPVPGRPDSAMICNISLLALGGSCGMLTNGADYVGPVDDPDTLDAEELRQCDAWWNQIIGARTQEVWRKTRALYETECRKPRLQQR